MYPFDNIQHTLSCAAYRNCILTSCSALQNRCLDIQKVGLLQNAYQQTNLARCLRINDKQMLDMRKGFDGECACKDHFTCRCHERSLFLGDLQLITRSEQIVARLAKN